MKIVINIEKKHFYIILAVIVVVSGLALVKAYDSFPYSAGNPSSFGHSMNEMEGLDENQNGIVDDCEIEGPSGNITIYEWVKQDFIVDPFVTGGFVEGKNICAYVSDCA